MSIAGSSGPVSTDGFRKIGNTELEGRVSRGLITVRGPCGGAHTMSFDVAGQLALWLTDQLRPTIEAEVIEEPYPPRL